MALWLLLLLAAVSEAPRGASRPTSRSTYATTSTRKVDHEVSARRDCCLASYYHQHYPLRKYLGNIHNLQRSDATQTAKLNATRLRTFAPRGPQATLELGWHLEIATSFTTPSNRFAQRIGKILATIASEDRFPIDGAYDWLVLDTCFPSTNTRRTHDQLQKSNKCVPPRSVHRLGHRRPGPAASHPHEAHPAKV